MEFIIAIAALCNMQDPGHYMSTGNPYQRALACQKWYVHCWEEKKTNKKYKLGNEILVDCIKEKE